MNKHREQCVSRNIKYELWNKENTQKNLYFYGHHICFYFKWSLEDITANINRSNNKLP